MILVKLYLTKQKLIKKARPFNKILSAKEFENMIADSKKVYVNVKHRLLTIKSQ
jgi:hypothetical protein